MKPASHYRIFNMMGKVLRTCRDEITRDDLNAAAKTYGFKFYEVHQVNNGSNKFPDDLPLNEDVYITEYVRPEV